MTGGLKLTTCLPPVPSLRMNGEIQTTDHEMIPVGRVVVSGAVRRTAD
jgi:hypothetical protein